MNWILDILKILSVCIASGVGIYGINSWRREIKWKKKYELTETLRTLLYETEDAIKSIRSPLIYENEGKSRIKEKDESIDESKLLDSAYIVFERYGKYKETFYKLRSIKYRFMAIFGKEHKELFNKIDLIVNEIFDAARLLGTIYWQNQGKNNWESEDEFKQHLVEKHKYEKVIWFMGTDDKINKEVEQIISAIENICNK